MMATTFAGSNVTDKLPGSANCICRDVVSPMAISKSGRVLYAFAYFYLPFYGYRPDEIFWQFDPFAWISSYVYEIDEEVERGVPLPQVFDRFANLSTYLSSRATLDCSIIRLFEDAHRYYTFEHDLIGKRGQYSPDDLLQITAARSFDFRLLHRVLAQRSGEIYRESLFDWFRALEMLMEIEDDILSAAKDIARNTFNVVNLALQSAPEEGAAFVEQMRRTAESELRLREKQLSKVERDLCARTLTLYRNVVARTPLLIPDSNLKARHSA